MTEEEYRAAIAEYKSNRLEHGGEWKKHKYIRIENGRYIYPEDLNKDKESYAVKKADAANNRAHFNAAANAAGSKDRVGLDKNGSLASQSEKVLEKLNNTARAAQHPGQVAPSQAKPKQQVVSSGPQMAKPIAPNSAPVSNRNQEKEREMNADRSKTINDTINSFVDYAAGKGESMFSNHLDKFFEKYDDYLDERGSEVEKQIMQAVGSAVEMKLKSMDKNKMDSERLKEIEEVLSKYKKVQHSLSRDEFYSAVYDYKKKHSTQRVPVLEHAINNRVSILDGAKKMTPKIWKDRYFGQAVQYLRANPDLVIKGYYDDIGGWKYKNEPEFMSMLFDNFSADEYRQIMREVIAATGINQSRVQGIRRASAISHSEEDYLEHHGILGQKWGIRRYQNADGTLTDLGRHHQGKIERIDAKIEKLDAKTWKNIGKHAEKTGSTGGYDLTQDRAWRRAEKLLNKKALLSVKAHANDKMADWYDKDPEFRQKTDQIIRSNKNMRTSQLAGHLLFGIPGNILVGLVNNKIAFNDSRREYLTDKARTAFNEAASESDMGKRLTDKQREKYASSAGYNRRR